MRRLLEITICLLLSSAVLLASDPSSGGRARHPVNTRVRSYRRVQFGIASWYGPGLQNHVTASGAPFDQHKLTAAHRTLPLGTNVQVTNLKNGRSVIVKVTDRGPWVRTRLIDVSRAAAEVLGFNRRGLTRVKVAIVHPAAQAPAQPADEAVRQPFASTSSPYTSVVSESNK
jgi:rare lipoprotein A